MAAAVVVGAQFCSPRALRLTLTMNLTRGGTVTDDASGGGAVVLRMEIPLFLRFFGRFVLVDVAGRPLVSVQRKAFSLCGAWEAFRGDGHGHSEGELLFTAKKSRTILQVRTHMDIFLASNRAQQVCDFKIKCSSFYEGSADIYLGNSGTVIAQIRRRRTAAGVMLGKSTFCVTVFPNVDYAFIMALAVMLNEIHVAGRRDS